MPCATALRTRCRLGRPAATCAASRILRPEIQNMLAAGGSRRLGRPKQLLPYGPGSQLGHVLATARECAFDQLLCVLGGEAAEIRERVDLAGVETVQNHHFGEG